MMTPLQRLRALRKLSLPRRGHGSVNAAAVAVARPTPTALTHQQLRGALAALPAPIRTSKTIDKRGAAAPVAVAAAAVVAQGRAFCIRPVLVAVVVVVVSHQAGRIAEDAGQTVLTTMQHYPPIAP